jgi:hypothetical protein
MDICSTTSRRAYKSRIRIVLAVKYWNLLGGRKTVCWLILQILCFIALGIDWISDSIWSQTVIWTTTALIVGNVASKFALNIGVASSHIEDTGAGLGGQPAESENP